MTTAIQPVLPGTEKAYSTQSFNGQVQSGSEIDRTGAKFSEMLVIQKEHLELLKIVLLPEVHKALTRYCERKTRKTDGKPWPEGRHVCPRGNELWNWIMTDAKLRNEMASD